MRSGVMGLLGATYEAARAGPSLPPPAPAGPGLKGHAQHYWDPVLPPPGAQDRPLPTLLGSARGGGLRLPRGGGPALDKAGAEEYALDLLPDFSSALGAGAYGGVYPLKGCQDKVVKVYRLDDWPEVIKESSFARDMKAHDPQHFVQCYGIGRLPQEGVERNFAVFERAGGVTLSAAAHRFHKDGGVQNVHQALGVLEQLAAVMLEMMRPDANGNVHFHLDLKPDNIMVSKGDRAGGELRVTLIDYGVVQTCRGSDAAAAGAARQMFRWLGWELLWVLSSERFGPEATEPKSNPWDQVPEGFLPFFRPSDLRPPAYRTDSLSPELIESAMGDAYFEQVMSPDFRSQWTNPAAARRRLGRLLGSLFHDVARASDQEAFAPDLAAIRGQLRELRLLAAPE